MTTLSDEDVRALLKRAVSTPAVGEPRPEIWREVCQRLDRAPERPRGWEYALIGGVALLCLLRPSVLEFLLLHL